MAGIVVFGDCQTAEFGGSADPGWWEVVSADGEELLSRFCCLVTHIVGTRSLRDVLLALAVLQVIVVIGNRLPNGRGRSQRLVVR